MSGSLLLAHPSGVISMDGPAHYLHWGVVQISVGNAIVIGAMLAVFALALVLPFPGSRR